MSTTAPATSSNVAAFIAAVNVIISRQRDFFDNDVVQIYDLREGEDGISVTVALSGNHCRVGPKRRSSKLRMDVELTSTAIAAVSIDGREVPSYMWDKDPDFAEATIKVQAAAAELTGHDPEAAPDDAEAELDELSMEYEEGLGNPNRRFSRRQAILELGRLAADGRILRRL